jgi:hypothetical protein
MRSNAVELRFSNPKSATSVVGLLVADPRLDRGLP